MPQTKHTLPINFLLAARFGRYPGTKSAQSPPHRTQPLISMMYFVLNTFVLVIDHLLFIIDFIHQFGYLFTLLLFKCKTVDVCISCSKNSWKIKNPLCLLYTVIINQSNFDYSEAKLMQSSLSNRLHPTQKQNSFRQIQFIKR